MSIAPKTLRKLRIIAIPLTRPKIATRLGLHASPASRILTYYQFQIGYPQKPESSPESEVSQSKWIPEGGIMKWITTKAGDTWAGFGKAKGGWKLKVYQVGERLVDRLDFEELALKGIDPSLGPTVAHPGVSAEGNDVANHQTVSIPLIYPPSINSGPLTLAELRALILFRTPRHRKGFYMWMIIAPFTAPFMIIPIIPNLPFFFCVWRSWSHYKAYRASQYLQTLLDSESLVPEASEALDTVYRDFSPEKAAIYSSNATQGEKPQNPPHTNAKSATQHEVLLDREAVPAILNIFSLKPSASADLLRAVEQARVRVQSGRGVL